MSTVLVKNVMSSLLDMSAIKDVNGNPVTLQPKGKPGDRRECPAAVVNDEVVQRVRAMKWIEIESTAVAPPPSPPVPAEAAPPAQIVKPAKAATPAPAADDPKKS